MTKIKLCGMMRECDIDYVNELKPDYIGFIFVEGLRRYVSPEKALAMRSKLAEGITPVGVFINESRENILKLIESGTIEAVQLHGDEDNNFIEDLRKSANCVIIKAFKIKSADDIEAAKASAADYVLLDSGQGTGKTFDHTLIKDMGRRFFLAGGLGAENVGEAIEKYAPFAVDTSSALETDGFKDKEKMTAFVNAVRKGKV